MTDSIRWGILGCAAIAGSAVVPAINASRNGRVAAVASRDAVKARSFADRHEVPKAYGSYESLLDDPDIDAIYLPVPIAQHAEWALRCAAAGKPVLVEKPFAINADEGRKVCEAFNGRGLVLGEANMFRFHPLTVRVADLVHRGAIGRLELLRATFAVDIPDRNDIRWQADTGGGALRDLGCYCVSLMRMLTCQEPISVAASGRFAETGVDAALVGSMSFPDGSLGHFGCSLSARFDCSYEAIGSSGRLRVDHGGMVPWPGSAFTIELWTGDILERITIPPANHYQIMVEAFADAVRGVAPYPLPISDAIATATVMDRLLSSAKASSARSLQAQFG